MAAADEGIVFSRGSGGGQVTRRGLVKVSGTSDLIKGWAQEIIVVLDKHAIDGPLFSSSPAGSRQSEAEGLVVSGQGGGGG